MIILGLGANLPSPKYGPPKETLEAALAHMAEFGIHLSGRSSWYESTAVPPSDQPKFVNGVVAVETELGPKELLERLHVLEAEFGRVRRVRWEARIVDIDLLAYHDLVMGDPDEQLKSMVLPHPRMHERLFVMKPLAELAPDWRHPVLKKTAAELAKAIPEGDIVEPLRG